MCGPNSCFWWNIYWVKSVVSSKWGKATETWRVYILSTSISRDVLVSNRNARKCSWWWWWWLCQLCSCEPQQLWYSHISITVRSLALFDMANSKRFNILSISIFSKISQTISIFFIIALSISIFCQIPLSISILMSIFFRMALSISISILIFFKFADTSTVDSIFDQQIRGKAPK